MSKKFFYGIMCFLLAAIAACLFFILKMPDNEENPPSEKYIRIQANNCRAAANNPVNIALITDSRYAPPTMVAMSSAIRNKCPQSRYNFYIIAENITPADEQAVLKLKNLAPDTVNITIIPQQEPDLPYENMQRFLQYKVGMHKIYLPEILSTLDKVIYMDGDTLVL